jgi:hypothetical protein
MSDLYRRLFLVACALLGIAIACIGHLNDELLARDMEPCPTSNVMQLEPTEIRARGSEVYEL